MALPNPGLTLEPGRTALVLTDLQNDFLSPGGNGWALFADSYATVGAVEKVLPVDLVIKGCPPRPIDLLRGLLALMDKVTAKAG